MDENGEMKKRLLDRSLSTGRPVEVDAPPGVFWMRWDIRAGDGLSFGRSG